MTPEEKLQLITENLQEVLNVQIIKDVLQERDLKLYWGTAPTGKPHCGYLIPLIKLLQFLQAGCSVTVLMADLHAFLDNMKAPLELVEYRSEYYERLIKTVLVSLGCPIDRLNFVKGSSYQTTSQYTMDIFKMCNVCTQNDARRAGADVVKQVESPLVSGLIYPLMQALDEHYLDVDAQFGGVDQRKIFVLAEEFLPKIGYKKRAHLMNFLAPGLTPGGKMSSSDANSKIDFLDEPSAVKKKINSAYCSPGEVENNGLLALCEYVFFPVSRLKDPSNPHFRINRPDKWGGPITYTSFEALKDDFAQQKLSPQDLKLGVLENLQTILDPIRNALQEDSSFAELTNRAYPPPPTKEKKPASTEDIASVTDAMKTSNISTE
ncbi:hypothetical protein CANCADRAFT_57525 [Tortispora caseinolytica NRRL Y-17796]|uniref:Tyrosine--tRNA ligase n=1 Tax=Tortispora caseinolytica NRRL Y-17796 TaxID=767744 RepID=A0A1E4THQ3_9ASCO|nr:hypothetical protein CANCADRAFT_57525 [Tortispora caseinolytica NRRL Y-17796]